MREIKKYVRFYVQKRRTWTDQSLNRPRNLVMMFNYDGKRLCTLTGLKISENDWDTSKQRVKLTVKRAKQVNGVLDLLEEKVNDIYYDAIGNGKKPDNNYIMRELKKDKNAKIPTFFDEWDKYLNIRKHTLKSSSMTSLRISYDHFKNFAKGMRIEFDDINSELVSKYADYLFGIGHSDNTVHKNIKRLRIFMSYTKKIGLHSNERYRDYNVSQKDGRIVFLDWTEVKRLIDYKTDDELERRVLDNFLFGCMTAMRFSDYHALKRSEIEEVSFEGIPDVFHAAKFRQLKTNKMTVIPLLPEALAIVNRNSTQANDLALPKVTNQVINRTIKDICKKVGINSKVPVDTFKGEDRVTSYSPKWSLVTSHTARKTFISVAASKSLPISLVASIAGALHKDLPQVLRWCSRQRSLHSSG
jgi:site-specific recombinase XerD